MGIVKHKFLQEGEEGQLCEGPVEGGQLGATGVSTHGHQGSSHHHHGPRDEHIVEEDGLQHMAKPIWIHLEDQEGITG